MKALSPKCDVVLGDETEVKRHFGRLPYSKEEIDTITNGGYEDKVIGDWRKIKV